MRLRAVLVAMVMVLVGAFLPATATYAATTSISWGNPATVLKPQGGTSAISCPSSTFCAVVDVSGRAVPIHRGVPGAASDIGGSLQSVSCVSEHFCAVGGTSGEVSVLRGGRWSARRSLGGGQVAVSCASKTFCLTLFGAFYSRYNGHSWSSPARFTSRAVTFSEISCTSATYCVAIGNRFDTNVTESYGYRWNGSRWLAGIKLHPSQNRVVNSLGCVGTAFCLASDGTGALLRYSHGRWTFDDNRYSESDDADVSCGSAGFCVLVTSNSSHEGVFESHLAHGTWTAARRIIDTAQHAGASVSCSSARSCTAVSFYGDASSWTGTWSPPHVVDHAEGGNTSGPQVSCGSPRFCVEVDEYGNYLAYDGRAWTVPRRINRTALGTTQISCSGPRFCLTVDSRGRGWVYNGISWKATAIAPLPVRAYTNATFSCGTSTFCMVTTGGGLTSISNGERWSSPVRFDSRRDGAASVSCTSSRSCGILDDTVTGKRLITYVNRVWAAPVHVPEGVRMTNVSCAGRSFCMVTSYNSNDLLTYSKHGFTHVKTAVQSLESSSCITPRLCVVNEYGDYQLWNGTTLGPAMPLTDDIFADDSSTSCVAPMTCAAVGLTGAVVGN